MKSIDRLVKEHDLIERALTLLESSANQLESGQPVPPDFPSWAAEFFRQFADGCHHAKEEDLFFPLLKERGIPQEGGPIGLLRGRSLPTWGIALTPMHWWVSCMVGASLHWG